MENQMVFQRIEKKYLLTPQRYRTLMHALTACMVQDQYGLHTITSVYLDTDDFKLIRTSVQKPIFKEKMRLRWYGIPKPDDDIFLELKRKYHGVVYKRRIAISCAQAEQMLAGGDVLLMSGQIASEMDWFLKRYQPQPKLLLAYDREALQGRTDKSLRITFDHNIRWRTRQWSLAEGSWGTPLLSDDSVLMEIKAFGSLPIWLVNLLAEERIYPSSFSKYGTWYTHNDIEKEGIQRVG